MSKFIIASCILAVACSAQAINITATQIKELAETEGQKYDIYSTIFDMKLKKVHANVTETAKSFQSAIQWTLEALLDQFDDTNLSSVSDLESTAINAAATATACVQALQIDIDASMTSLGNKLEEFSEKIKKLTSIAEACESDKSTEYACVIESSKYMAEGLTPQWSTLGILVTELLEYMDNFETMVASCVEPFDSVQAKIDGIADVEYAYASSEEATSSSDPEESSSSFDPKDSYASSDSEDSSSSSASDDLYSSFDPEEYSSTSYSS